MRCLLTIINFILLAELQSFPFVFCLAHAVGAFMQLTVNNMECEHRLFEPSVGLFFVVVVSVGC